MADDPASHAVRAGHESGAVLIDVKVVPGARRQRVVGWLGDRLKIAVSAPPEAGKANAAVCALVAKTLGVGRRDVEVVAGQTSPAKTLRVSTTGSSKRSLDPVSVRRRLGEVLEGA